MRNLTAARRNSWFTFEQYRNEVDPPGPASPDNPTPCLDCCKRRFCTMAYGPDANDCDVYLEEEVHIMDDTE